jgi:hypothetical protein
MNLRLIAPALLCAVTACKTPTHTPPPGIQALQDQRQALIDKIGSDTLKPLSEWQQESPPSCTSPLLAKASGAVLLTANLLKPADHGLDMVRDGGSWILQVADAARQHHCKEVARDLYDTVIATYIGAAALRQRAQIGIDDLRQ